MFPHFHHINLYCPCYVLCIYPLCHLLLTLVSTPQHTPKNKDESHNFAATVMAIRDRYRWRALVNVVMNDFRFSRQ
jgi:hypothetical protein